MPPARHLPALDGLRGIAIALVLFHHLWVFEPTGRSAAITNSVVELASHGVDLFFVLSGFLISRQLTSGIRTNGFARKFWFHRMAKIVPLYLLVVGAVFVALKPLLALTGHPEKLQWVIGSQNDWPWYLAFASNIHNALAGRFTNPALDVSWSLAVEVQFYCLAYVLARVLAPQYWPRLALAGIVCALLFRAMLVARGAAWITVLVLTPCRLDAFAFGTIAAVAPSWLRRLRPPTIACLVLVPFSFPWSRATPAVEIAGYSLFALLAGMAVEAASRSGGPTKLQLILGAPFLAFLGRISYSVYLIHLPIRAALRDMLLPADRVLGTSGSWIAQGMFLVGAGAACIAAGWLVWRFFEEAVRLAILDRTERAISRIRVPA